MKAKITQEHLEKLEIVNKLRSLNGQIDTTKYWDIEVLAYRLVCRVDLLIEVLESMGCEILE